MLTSATTCSAQPVITVNHHTIPDNPSTGYFILSIDLSNAGDSAKNIEMQIYENEKNFALVDKYNRKVSSLYVDLGDLSAGTTSSAFKVFAEKSGIYQINVRVKYTYFINNTGYRGSIDKIIAVIVSEKPSFITNASISIKPSESKRFSIKIKNVGGKAKEVKISFESPENIVCNTNLAFKLWNTDEEKEILVELFADKNADVGAYILNMKVSYIDEFGNKNIETIPIAVEVYGTPKLVLAGFSTTPERIYPDSEFSLNVKIENIGSDEAKNVVCKLKIPEGFSGENEKFLGSIDKNKEANTKFTLNADNKTKSGSYPFTATVHYEDRRSRIHSNSYNFQIFISKFGVISLDIAGVYTSPQTIVSGSTFKLSLQIENSGKQDAKAVSVQLLLPKGFEGKDSYFIGSLESRDSATATFELKAGDSGKQDVKAVINYIDSKFEKHEVTREFALYVFPKSYSELYGIIAFLVALAVLYYWRRKRAE